MSKAQLCGLAIATLLLATIVTAAPALAATGSLLWENRGQPTPFGTAVAVAVHGNIVVASGNVNTDTSNPATADWFVRAADATTGATLWEDRLDATGSEDRSQGIAIDGSRVFASGWVRTPATGFDFVVRAYDLRTGALLWQQRIDRGGRFELAEVIAAGGGRVYAAGRVLGASGSSDFAVFAFDGRTGDLLWQSVTDPRGRRLTDVAWAVSLKGDRVFAAGTIGGVSDLLVRAYDAETGRIIWEDVVLNATNVLDNKSLAVAGDTLYASGVMWNSAGGGDFLVRAYDATTGALRWSDQFAGGGVSEATALAVAGGRLIAAGYAGCDPATGGGCDWLVRAYSADSGALLWQDRLPGSGGDAQAVTIAAQDSRVYVGGGVAGGSTGFAATLRAYGTKSGQLLWQDSAGQGGPFSFVFDLAVQGDRLFAATNVAFNFSIRAYRTQGP